MVSSLGGIPLANPLQNPVMTGLGQYYNAVYSPLQMMSAPLQSLAMASMYGDRGMMYQGAANKDNTQATLMQNGDTGSLGSQLYALSQAGANNQALQNYMNSYMQKPAVQNAVGGSTIAKNTAAAANQGTNAINNGYTGTVVPTTITPGVAAGIPSVPSNGAPNGVITPTQSSQPTGLTPQGNSPGQMQGLQGQLNNLTQGQSPQQQQYNYNQSFDQWSPQDQQSYMQTNNMVPPLPQGTPINPKIDATTMTKINAMPQIAGQLSQLKQLYNDPSVAPYVGKNASNYIAAAQAQMARGGQVPVGYQNYQAAMNLSNMVTDGITRTMAGSRAATIMAQFNKSFNGGNAYGLPQFNQTVSQAAQDAYNSASTYVGTNYAPNIRQTAYMGAQRLMKSGLLPSSQSAPSSQPESAVQSSIIPGIPDSFAQQYMQQKGWGK